MNGDEDDELWDTGDQNDDNPDFLAVKMRVTKKISASKLKKFVGIEFYG